MDEILRFSERRYGKLRTDWFLFPFLQKVIYACTEDKIYKELKKKRICQLKISLILDIGCIKWKTCATCVKNNVLPVHGLAKKVSNHHKRFMHDLVPFLHVFFDEVKEIAMPESTRFMREEIKEGLREGKDEVITFPTSCPKRGLYYRFCNNCRQKIVTNNVGICIAHKRDNFNHQVICSWIYFLSFWKKEYPEVQIKKASKDICIDCHVFHHRFKFNTSILPEDIPQFNYGAVAPDPTEEITDAPTQEYIEDNNDRFSKTISE